MDGMRAEHGGVVWEVVGNGDFVSNWLVIVDQIGADLCSTEFSDTMKLPRRTSVGQATRMRIASVGWSLLHAGPQ